MYAIPSSWTTRFTHNDKLFEGYFHKDTRMGEAGLMLRSFIEVVTENTEDARAIQKNDILIKELSKTIQSDVERKAENDFPAEFPINFNHIFSSYGTYRVINEPTITAYVIVIRVEFIK